MIHPQLRVEFSGDRSYGILTYIISSEDEVHMISRTSGKKIRIYITTYKSDYKEKDYADMNDKKPCRAKCNLCSICLSAKPEHRKGDCNKIVTKSCPICHKNCNYCYTGSIKDKERCKNVAENSPNVKNVAENSPNVKNVQTSDTSVNQGLNLLNEVLTVFQNKKVDVKEKIKPVPSKDVAVATDSKKSTSSFTVSTFYYSIDEWKRPENGMFVIVNSYQPEFMRKSQYSIDLIKHKSSSIPQMKLEELKYTVKQKTKSKDTIEEVNRMFATVRRTGKHIETSNRPVVRNGPRVLPVVKTLDGQDFINANVENLEKASCRCCQTCMSSGDTFSIQECCHDTNNSNCDRNVYRHCCHYQNKLKLQADVICECCRSVKDKNYYCEHENCDDCC